MQVLLLATHYPVFGSLASFSCPTAAVFPTNPGLSTALITAAEHHRWSVHSSLCVLLLQTLQVFYVFSPKRMFFLEENNNKRVKRDGEENR